MTSDTPSLSSPSILIVAHPDDEALWLSSVLERVDQIVFCFQDCASAPQLGPGRARLAGEYPLHNVANLGLEEALSFNTANWNRPRLDRHGIHIARDGKARARYEDNFHKLTGLLSPLLAGYRTVFTHNPWGEYGHEDHIQVYRVVKTLQEQFGFDLWFSNYCSQKSAPLMLEHVSGFSSNYVTLPTNRELAHELRDLYKKHGCWTWYKDYQWFKEESLMPDSALDTAHLSHGHIFPVNMLKTDFPDPGPPDGCMSTLRRLLARR